MTKAEMNHLLSLGPTSAAGNTPISAGTGFTSYQPTSRQWAKPEAVEALRNIGDAWSAAHPGEPRIQVGDVGKPEGGPFPPHKSHQNGVDLDVRPMRSDGREGPTQWNNAQTYSRDLTRDLVRTIVGNGSLPVRMIFFNDPQLQREFPGVVLPQHGHDDHLHIRFQTP